MGAKLLLGQGTREERREAPASEKVQGKVRAMEVLTPPETDE